MATRTWYSENLLDILCDKLPGSVEVKIVGSLKESGYLYAEAKGVKYTVRLSDGQWSPCFSADSNGDLSEFVGVTDV